MAHAVRSLSQPLEAPLPDTADSKVHVASLRAMGVDQPRIRFSRLRADRELTTLAERIAKRADSVRMAERSGSRAPLATNGRLTGTRKPIRDDEGALPPSQLEGRALDKKVNALFEKAVQLLVNDGTVVVSVEESDDTVPVRSKKASSRVSDASSVSTRWDDTPKATRHAGCASSVSYEDAFSLPTWRNLGVPILEVLARAEAAGAGPQDRCLHVDRIVEVLQKKDDRWGAVDASVVLEVLVTLDGLDEVQRVGDGCWRVC